MSKIQNNQKGAVALITILIVMVVTLAVALSINLRSISEVKTGFSESQSAETFVGSDACVEEALIRLAWDDTYTGGSLNFNDVSCTIVVSGNGYLRTIISTSVIENITRKIQASVDLSGEYITISSWQELTN